MRNLWVSDTRRNLICIDSYTGGVPSGEIFAHGFDPIPFSSLSQLLVSMDELLDKTHTPQSFTTPRRFTSLPDSLTPGGESPAQGSGKLATFELAVLFRQNSSWQGTLRWVEENREEPFRSVLELILLLDSALQGGGSDPH